MTKRAVARLAATSSLVTLVWACAPSEDTSPRVTVTDSAGISVVESDPSDEILDWTFRESWRVGGLDDGPEAFYGLRGSGIGVDSLGRVHVLDAGNFRVSVWDSTGTYVTSYGQEGDGPGELGQPRGLAASPDGTTAVYDASGPALDVFTLEGSVSDQSRTLPLFITPEIGYAGSMLTYVTFEYADDRILYRLLLDQEGDTTQLAALDVPVSALATLPSCDSPIAGLSRAFEVLLHFSARNDDVVVTDRAAYEVRWFDAGELRRIVRLTVPARYATEADAVEAMEPGLPLARPGGREVICSAEDLVEYAGYAREIPAIVFVRLSPTHLWVARRPVGGEQQLIDIFGMDGAYVGTLDDRAPLPATFLPDGRLITIETDSLDREYLVVYELEGDRG